MQFLRATIKLYMHSPVQCKVCLWWQTCLAQGSLSAVHSIQVHQCIWLISLIWFIFPFTHTAVWEAYLLKCSQCAPHNPSRLVLLNVN